MENFYIVSVTISIFYVVLKFIEMRFVSKENIAIKEIMRDTIMVFISTVGGMFIIDQIKPLGTVIKTSTGTQPPSVFADAPGF
jgi:hypothetical protein